MSEISRILRLKPLGAFVLYVVFDIFCVGLGMEVPVANIMFGFVVGWYIVQWVSVGTPELKDCIPRMSFIGWLLLMIVISPFLQMLTTVFAGNLTLWSMWKKDRTLSGGTEATI